MDLSAQRKRGEWEERRQAVLAASARLFADRGMEAVSMRDIGAACGLHMSTIYHYFANKAELYEAVCGWSYETITRLVLDCLDTSSDPATQLEAFSRTLAAMFVRNGPEIGILERELVFAKSGDRPGRVFPAFMAEPGAHLAEILERLAPPILTAIPAPRLAEILWDIAWGMTRYFPVHVTVTGRQPVDGKVLEDEVWACIAPMLGLAR